MRKIVDILFRTKIIVGYIFKYLFIRQFRAIVKYTKYSRKFPIDEKVFLFEVYRGEKIGDTPYAMFLEMLNDTFYSDVTFIWTINSKDNAYRKKISHFSNVKFCRRDDRQYVKALAQAKYLINNKAFPHYFIKRDGQIHISSWHATAFKALGKHQGGAMGQFKNITRNYVQTDYLVMPNRFTSDIMLESTDVHDIFPGYVIEEGYPRNDLIINTKREEIAAILKDVLSFNENKKIILYAPTWRGETGNYENTTQETFENLKEIQKNIGDGYELFLKVHDLTAKYIEGNAEASKFKIIPDWIDTNELLNIVDILITDYSSIFIDFLILERPIIFYTYDLEEYTKDRGLYFDMNDMPGPNCFTAAEVVSAVKEADKLIARYQDRYDELKEKFCGRDDGNAGKRVCDIIFKKKISNHMYRSYNEKKKKIVIASDMMPMQKETSWIIQFSELLDYGNYDLTVLCTAPVNKDNTKMLKSLHKKTRVFYSVFYRTANWNRTFIEYYHDMQEPRITMEKKIAYLNRHKTIYHRQLKRLIGEIEYDIAIIPSIEYSQYSAMLLYSDIKTKILLANAEDNSKNCFPPRFYVNKVSSILTDDKNFAEELRREYNDVKLQLLEPFVSYTLPLKLIEYNAQNDLEYMLKNNKHLTKAYDYKQQDKSINSEIHIDVGNILERIDDYTMKAVEKIKDKYNYDPDKYNHHIMQELYKIFD